MKNQAIHAVWGGVVVLTAALLYQPHEAFGAPFNSGSTGADGAFSPTANTALTLPPSGVFNFTTVNVPAGVTVTFVSNAANTPVTILASGDVTIAGSLSLTGQNGAAMDVQPFSEPFAAGGAGGPGGYAGGYGGLAPAWNNGTVLGQGAGSGPGGGGTYSTSGCGGSFASNATYATSCTASGLMYGSPTLLPLIGGSGGAGGVAMNSGGISCGANGCNGGGGGGGGGAILLASSGTITITGNITANGGNGGNGYTAGGPGSGGAIRLIANAIAGSGVLSAVPGLANRHGFGAGNGRIRMEASALNFTGTATPSTQTSLTVSTPGLVNFSPVPTLSITAIAGVAVPPGARGDLASPDITFPSSTTNPLTVSLAASNIPTGTVVKVTVTPRNSYSSSANSTALTGSQGSSTATASVNVSTVVPSTIRAETTFAVQTASLEFPVFADGERVERVRVASVLGAHSEVFLITESGREVRWR